MLLAELVAPFVNGVLLATDEVSSEGLPPWSSMRQLITTSRTAFAARVRHAQEGDVDVYVWSGKHSLPGVAVSTISLQLDSGILRLSDLYEDHVTRVRNLRPGTHRIDVIVDDTRDVCRVDLVIGEA
jgi:hypothetical protein